MDLIETAAAAIELGMIVIAFVILIIGLDDLLMDVLAHLRRLYRRVFVYSRHATVTRDDLLGVPEQAIAVLVPAWDEGDVILRMLETNIARIEYRNYRFFVGYYPNDPATYGKLVDAMRRFPGVTAVPVPHPGPSNKADCLNAIHGGIKKFEKDTGTRFAIFVLHDAEDVIDPLAFHLFNLLIPRKDMVQLPVFALTRPFGFFTGGHYLDEFAESHGKELPLREWLTRSVPCAGVGCGFSRRAMDVMASLRKGQPFNTGSLTEDYDFSLQLKYLGLRQIFAKVRINGRLVATREYFPDELNAATRQKARWLIGIVFQSLASNGWHGPWRFKYALYRDRRGVLTAFLGVAAYFAALCWALLVLSCWITGHNVPSIAANGSLLETLLVLNVILLFNRSLHRAFYVWRLYGIRQAMLAIPRQVWGNVVNFLAACRAIRLFLAHRLFGRALTWDKTRHSYPTSDEMAAYDHATPAG